jgi:hypothetical protein
MTFSLNEYLLAHRDVDSLRVQQDYEYPRVPRIKCVDGFTISVQASHGAYCSPRLNIAEWTAVECGFPSAEPEFIMDYCEDSDDPTGTVYGYVPIGLVEKLIEFHGGFLEADVSNQREGGSMTREINVESTAEVIDQMAAVAKICHGSLSTSLVRCVRRMT